MQRLHTLSCPGGGKENRITRIFIDLLQFFCPFPVLIHLVQYDLHRYIRVGHLYQITVDETEAGFRCGDRKNDNRLVSICNCRANQSIATGQNLLHIADMFRGIQDLDHAVVSNQRAHSYLTEYAPGLTFIYNSILGGHIVEAADSFNYLSDQ